MSESVDRRHFIQKTALASAATLAVTSWEEKNLIAHADEPAAPSASGSGNGMSYGKIKDLTVSRIFCGGNLIGGWAHSRDLIYVSDFIKAYHTDEKVFETFELAEENGINTVLTNPRSDRVINRYWDERGGKIQWISDCAVGNSLKEGIQRSIDNGAHAVYIQGGLADRAVQRDLTHELGEALDFIRDQGVPGGLGAHCLDTVKACVDAGFKPDFWVKTLHSDRYWSAEPEGERTSDHIPQHDNMWCTNSGETIKYMESLKVPWIAFKVMAAGAIHPKDAFRFAYEGGADFICAGMFDFQVVEDVIIAKSVLNDPKLNQVRQRPWMA